MNKLVFIHQFLENYSNFSWFLLKFALIYNPFAVIEQHLEVSLPLSQYTFQSITESDLQFLIFLESLDQKIVVIIEKGDQ